MLIQNKRREETPAVAAGVLRIKPNLSLDWYEKKSTKIKPIWTK